MDTMAACGMSPAGDTRKSPSSEDVRPSWASYSSMIARSERMASSVVSSSSRTPCSS